MAAWAGLSESLQGDRGEADISAVACDPDKQSGPRCIEVPFFVAPGNGEHAWRLCQSNGGVVCAWHSTPGSKRPLGREGAPLGQRASSPLFVSSASDEMALLIEMVVDLSMN